MAGSVSERRSAVTHAVRTEEKGVPERQRSRRSGWCLLIRFIRGGGRLVIVRLTSIGVVGALIAMILNGAQR